MNRFSWTTIVLLALTIMLLAACSAEIQPANVSSVTIEQRDGVYAAVVEGEYPDACGRIGPIVQTVDGNTIKVGLVLAPTSPDMMCAQMITPYTEVVPLDTRGLPPGTYEANVNGVSAPLEISPEVAAQPASVPANVLSVEIDQRADGNVAVISGEMPDPCHEVGDISQRVEDGEIRVDVEMTPPAPDMVCAQVVTPFTVEVHIEATLEPGEYTIMVNDYVVDVTVQ